MTIKTTHSQPLLASAAGDADALLDLGVSLGGGASSASAQPPVVAGAIIGGGAAGTTPLASVGLGLGGLAIGVTVGTGGLGAPTGSIGVGVGGAGGISIGVGGGSGSGGTITIGVGAGGAGGGGSSGSGSGGGVAVGESLPDPHTAFVNIFRLESASQIPAGVDAQLDALEGRIAAGQITAKQAVLAIVDAAAGFTAVAETSYQFFTGLTPTAAGLTYLVHSTGNPADLSDAYYDAFNLENRYINFASNLGLHSDYAPEFASVYGAMSFEAAVATAYERIVGRTSATAAGLNPDAAVADIASRRGYFEAVAHERFAGDDFGLSTKLAAIAYIMQEAVRADVGNYGEANQNFLFDLADGNARFNVDLVGLYGHGTPLDVA